jgi:hypothetical protein
MGNEIKYTTFHDDVWDAISTNGADWQPITGPRWSPDEHGFRQPWQLWLLDADITGRFGMYRVVIVERRYYDADRPDEPDYTETVFEEIWPL